MNKKISAAAAVCAALAVFSAFVPAVSADGWTGEPGASGYIRDGGYVSGVEMVDGIYYNFDGTDNAPALFTGFVYQNGKNIYIRKGISTEGSSNYDGWVYYGANQYYVKNGIAVTGTRKIGGVTYYFGDDGVVTGTDDASADTSEDKPAAVSSGSGEKVKVQPEGKSAWGSSTEIVKSLSSSDGGFTLEGNYLDMFYGKGSELRLDLYTNNGTQLTISSVEVQRKLKGKWARAAKTDNSAGLTISRKTIGSSDNHSQIVITPDLYFKKQVDGLHRAILKIETADGDSRTFQYEFNMKHNADVSCKKNYDLVSTKSITFTSTLNTECELYPDVNELYFWDEDKWNLVLPKKDDIVSSTETVDEGTFESVLDLTRYDTTSLRSGKYMVYLGDDVSAEFSMTRPVDVKGVQVRTADGSTKVQFTFNNRGSENVTLLDYTALWKASGKSWKALTPYSGADTSVKVSVSKGRYKARIVDISAMFGDLSEGSYRMRILTDSGEYVYAYFKIVE